MSRKVTIREIAQKAGVSIGTVDRVLHNRGRVSEQTRKRIDRILDEAGYRFNLHASAPATRRRCKIVVVLPESTPGSYWWLIWNGIQKALQEYDDMRVDIKFLSYSQFDIYSCRDTFATIIPERPDAVVIGTIFVSETLSLCTALEEAGISYFFVDSSVKEAAPVAAFSVDQHACGMLSARLLHKMAERDGKFVLFESSRIGDQWSVNAMARREGFADYFRACGLSDRLSYATFSFHDPRENDALIQRLLRDGEPLAGAAVMNSRGYVIADMFRQHADTHVLLLAFDATERNRQSLREGGIDVLLCQRPEMQGYLVTVAAIRHIVYKEKAPESTALLPIDILMKDNLPYYEEVLPL